MNITRPQICPEMVISIFRKTVSLGYDQPKNLHILKVSFIGIMAELRDQVFQYIGFEPNEIRLPIIEEDGRSLLCDHIRTGDDERYCNG